VRLLLSHGLTTPQKVTRIWPGFFSCRVPRAEFQNVDPILKRIGKFVSEEENKHGEQGMTADQIMEVAEEVHKTDSDGKKEQSAKDKWEFNKELGKNQKIFI
jgi:tRNA U54 and U55 pseudouridine synthase Pus10